MHQHHVEVFGVRQLAQLVDLFLRIPIRTRRHFRHQPVRIARDALQRDGQHLRHTVIALGSLEEADAAVVGVTHQLGELFLAKLALRLPAHGSGAECQPRHLNAGLPKRHPIRCRAACRPQPNSGPRHHTGGESSLQKVASGEMSH